MAGEIFDCAHCNRRGFLGRSLAATGLLLPATAAAAVEETAVRDANFYNTHTGESLTALYWEHGHYVPARLTEIDYVLRDFVRATCTGSTPNSSIWCTACVWRWRTMAPST